MQVMTNNSEIRSTMHLPKAKIRMGVVTSLVPTRVCSRSHALLAPRFLKIFKFSNKRLVSGLVSLFPFLYTKNVKRRRASRLARAGGACRHGGHAVTHRPFRQ